MRQSQRDKIDELIAYHGDLTRFAAMMEVQDDEHRKWVQRGRVAVLFFSDKVAPLLSRFPTQSLFGDVGMTLYACIMNTDSRENCVWQD